jgi:hypothetical protein
MRARCPAILALNLATLVLTGCSGPLGIGAPDLDEGRSFDGYPLYWVGERFGEWELEHVEVRPDGFTTLAYGTCEIGLFQDGGCAPPLQLQIQPLCAYLEFVAEAPIWRRREIRGAPVGTIDSAPVLFTDRVQVKVYRGQGSYEGLALDALRALRSSNAVPPVLDVDDPIPGASPAVLSGAEGCGA